MPPFVNGHLKDLRSTLTQILRWPINIMAQHTQQMMVLDLGFSENFISGIIGRAWPGLWPKHSSGSHSLQSLPTLASWSLAHRDTDIRDAVCTLSKHSLP